MYWCSSSCLQQIWGTIYIVVKLVNLHPQSRALPWPRVISLLGIDLQPVFNATQGLLLVFVVMLQDCPPPFHAGLYFDYYLPVAITNVKCFQLRPSAGCLLQDRHSFLFLSLTSKLDFLLQDPDQGACNYYTLRDPYSVVCAKHKKCHALSMVFALGPIPYLINDWRLWPSSCFPTDIRDYFYLVWTPVGLL